MGEGEEAGLARVAAALDEVHRRTEGLRRRDRPGDDRRAGDLPGPPVRAPGGDPRPRRPSPSGWASAWIPAIFSPRAIPWPPPEEYDETIDRLDRSVGLDRVRVWHLNDSCRELRQPRRSPRGDRAGRTGPGAVSPPGQRSAVPRLADDPGDAQGDRGRGGPRRPQRCGSSGSSSGPSVAPGSPADPDRRWAPSSGLVGDRR